MLIYDPLGSTWLLMFVIPYMIGTSCCREFPYPEFSLCRSKKYSHGPRSLETATRTNEARGYNVVPYGGAQDWHGRTWSVSGKCHSRGLIEPRNQRAAKIFRLCNAQRSPKNSKNSAQRFFNNENKPQSRPGKESCTQSIQEGIFLSSTTTAPLEGCFPPEHIFLLVWVPNSVWESLWSTLSWPKQKLRKNFSYKMTKHSTGESFWPICIAFLLLYCIGFLLLYCIAFLLLYCIAFLLLYCIGFLLLYCIAFLLLCIHLLLFIIVLYSFY